MRTWRVSAATRILFFFGIMMQTLPGSCSEKNRAASRRYYPCADCDCVFPSLYFLEHHRCAEHTKALERRRLLRLPLSHEKPKENVDPLYAKASPGRALDAEAEAILDEIMGVDKETSDPLLFLDEANRQFGAEEAFATTYEQLECEAMCEDILLEAFSRPL